MKRKIIPYNPILKQFARFLRNNSTKSEIVLWKEIKGKRMLGYDFHRQKPILKFIADFYCAELNLVIELDGITHQYEETKIRDRIKESELEKVGITVLRFEDKAIFRDLKNVLNSIENYILEFEKGRTLNPSQEGNK